MNTFSPSLAWVVPQKIWLCLSVNWVSLKCIENSLLTWETVSWFNKMLDLGVFLDQKLCYSDKGVLRWNSGLKIIKILYSCQISCGVWTNLVKWSFKKALKISLKCIKETYWVGLGLTWFPSCSLKLNKEDIIFWSSQGLPRPLTVAH